MDAEDVVRYPLRIEQMQGFMDDDTLEKTLATVHTLLQAEGMHDAADLVRTYLGRVEETGYDNWNGGTTIYEVRFEVPAQEYARLGTKRSRLEQQVTARLKHVLEPRTQDWYTAKIIPSRENRKDWRTAGRTLPRDVRIQFVDLFRLEQIPWNGALNEVEFLSRLYDLTALPSHDHRFKDAARDVWQHCINNKDWDPYWVFEDKRFDLLNDRSERFLRFLCEVVHPIVRPNRDEAVRLVSQFNALLRPVGWELFEEELIAGRPRFNYREMNHHGARAVFRARSVASALDAGSMAKAIERVENAIDRDPDLAIGTAKELVESCCKTLLTKLGIAYTKSEDLGDLTKKVTKELKLVPEGITDEAKGADNIRRILANLSQISNNIATLRGLYGTGHGRDGRHRGLEPRHARLAVASAVAFIDFVTDTYRHHESNNDPTSAVDN